MQLVRFVVAVLAEFAVIYLGTDLIKNGGDAINLVAGLIVLVVGSAFVLKSLEGSVEK